MPRSDLVGRMGCEAREVLDEMIMFFFFFSHAACLDEQPGTVDFGALLLLQFIRLCIFALAAWSPKTAIEVQSEH